MLTHIVVFEVNDENRKKRLKDKIRSFDYFCLITDSCWAIKSDAKAVDLRNQLSNILEASDRIFVLQSGHYAAWKNLHGDDVSEWLKSHL